jgi:hypothetical protein
LSGEANLPNKKEDQQAKSSFLETFRDETGIGTLFFTLLYRADIQIISLSLQAAGTICLFKA